MKVKGERPRLRYIAVKSGAFITDDYVLCERPLYTIYPIVASRVHLA